MLVAIVGATGTGKSDLSIALAQRLGRPVEIVGADAMQLYRGMDIGTAKLPVAERSGIPHHMLDVLEPSQEASVADYQRDARAAIEDIEARGAVPMLVGGSGLYVSSVIQDFQFPGTDSHIREKLERELAEVGAAAMHERLAALDPVAADGIGPHNGRRLVRALEVIELTGEPFGAGLPEHRPPWRDAVILGLRTDRDDLVAALDARAAGMWERGLLDEVRGLRPAGLGVTASRAIGYAQALAQLDGDLDEAAAIEQTSSLTRRLARRQVGWFRRYTATWLEADDPALVDRALDALADQAG
jgi:tRNA dimethylallyltransferase